MSVASRNLCHLCDSGGSLDQATEVAEIRSNVRQHAHETFTVWRCPGCASLHARDVVDLSHYYANYPFRRKRNAFADRLFNRNLFKRLVRAGLSGQHTLLDYGCGSGQFVQWLRKRGISQAHGFDAYSDAYSDRSVLDRTYDFVFVQDVIEHVEDPSAFLDELIALTKPGGIIYIGTPNADAINLNQPERHIHSLHQPYHLHILSSRALKSLAKSRNLGIEAWYDIYYADSFVPFANVRFSFRYARMFDNTLDLAFEPVHFSWRLLTPVSLALGMFGRWHPPKSEITVLLRKPK